MTQQVDGPPQDHRGNGNGNGNDNDVEKGAAASTGASTENGRTSGSARSPSPSTVHSPCSSSGRNASGTPDNGSATSTVVQEWTGTATTLTTAAATKSGVGDRRTYTVRSMVPPPQSATDDYIYEPLQWTRFNAVIGILERTKIRAPWYSPKGIDGISYPRGSDGFFTTLLVTRGRAFHTVAWAWLVCTLNATWWTMAVEFGAVRNPYQSEEQVNKYRSMLGIGLTTTLSFLLTFRLNRSILRFWEGMKAWGNIVSFSRSLVSGILVHGRDHPYHRDRAVVWTAAISVAAKNALRDKTHTCKSGQSETNVADLYNLLSQEDIMALNTAQNSPLYAANEVRYNLKKMLDVTKEHGPLSPARSSEMRQCEKVLDFMITNVTMTENLLASPLPLVYVTHLRTFLMVYLLALPYVLEFTYGWVTIPLVSITAALMLGIEGASAEVECPFDKGRVNDLDLDDYCETIMRDVQQLVMSNNMRENAGGNKMVS